MCKIQYVRKSETSFNITLNNHRKDIKKPNAIETCKHFNNNEHTFSKHSKFIIVEQLQNISTTPPPLPPQKIKNTKIEIERKRKFFDQET